MPGLQPGSPQGLIPSHLIMRAFAALPAAGAWAVSDAQPTFSYSRLTLFCEYDQGAAGGIVDVLVEVSPYSSAQVVPAAHNEWFPITILGLENAALGTIADGILEQLQFRFDPSTANQESFIIDLSLPDYMERFRIQCRESGVTGTPGSFGCTARLSIQDGAAEGLTRTVQTGIAIGGDVSVKPFSPFLEGGLTELIGADERVDQDEYSGSVGIALGGTRSEDILSVTLYTRESGTGAVLTPSGILFFFDADPTISFGDAAMSAAERVTAIGHINVASTDWQADANGASASIKDQPVPFHELSTLYLAWFHQDATSFNDAAGDDETLHVNLWIKRES